MAAGVVSRTAHFALHRCALTPSSERADAHPVQPAPLDLSPGVWLGALVPKRWARRAVTRNLIRRQIAAVGADDQSALPPLAHVVRLRASFDRKQFVSASSDALKAAVRHELQRLFSVATPLSGRANMASGAALS